MEAIIKSKKMMVYSEIKERIIRNELKPGTVLVERQLCVQLETSRTPVREALQLLASEGLVTCGSLKECVVSDISLESISKIYDVREYAEGLGTRLAASCITPEQEFQLKYYLNSMTECIEDEKLHLNLLKIDSQLHNFIVECSRNDLLIKIYNDHLRSQIRRITYLTKDNTEQIINGHQYHIDIVDSICARDSEKAEWIMREHIRKAKITHLNKFAKITIS
ncbi:MAG: GntR family transcriptional regulator [Eubacteriales bacterium]|nr:GntR family transcriptional regulator [Eubacteriales bacterium]